MTFQRRQVKTPEDSNSTEAKASPFRSWQKCDKLHQRHSTGVVMASTVCCHPGVQQCSNLSLFPWLGTAVPPPLSLHPDYSPTCSALARLLYAPCGTWFPPSCNRAPQFLILVRTTQWWDFCIPWALSSARWAGSGIVHSRSCNLPGPKKAPQ